MRPVTVHGAPEARPAARHSSLVSVTPSLTAISPESSSDALGSGCPDAVSAARVHARARASSAASTCVSDDADGDTVNGITVTLSEDPGSPACATVPGISTASPQRSAAT